MTRVAWSALIVLMLEALPTDAFAQSPVCHAIRPGESATQAARRMTGNGRNAYQAWFQIMNASSRFVPKSQYDRIHAGWRACVEPAIREPVFERESRRRARSCRRIRNSPRLRCSRSTRGAHGTREPRMPAIDRSPQPPTSFEGSRGVDLTMLWLCAAMGVPWLGWRIVDDYLARRKTASIVVRSLCPSIRR